MEGITVVICCYNSASRLPETLVHLAGQRLSTGIAVEIVLVDNASTDNTQALAQQVWANLHSAFPLKIVEEKRRGVQHARMTGIMAASQNIVVFCDDDNWLSEQYLQQAFDIMASDPGIGVCGGRGIAVFENEKPVWFDQYSGVFACSPQNDKDGFLGWNTVGLYSAGMVVRRDVVLQILATGYKSRFAARDDQRLSGGEDFELVVLIRTWGFKAYYSSALTFHHFMPGSRMTWKYLKRLVRGATINTAQAYVYADTLRYLYTLDERYRVSWIKDLLKATYGAFLTSLNHARDVQILWIRLTGAMSSVIKSIPNYSRYKREIERLYQLSHNKD
jgi:glycosyltransferase involved in cell wall biosynthesis